MSEFYKVADKLAEAMKADPGFNDVHIMVGRPDDLDSGFDKAVSKLKGLVLINFDSFSVPDSDTDRALLEGTYSINVYVKPIIRRGLIPSDELMESVCNVIHTFNYRRDEFHSCNYDARLSRGGPWAVASDINEKLSGYIVFPITMISPIYLTKKK